MGLIGRALPVATPPSLSWVRRAYSGPDGVWTLVLDDPREFHMGADGWRVSLLADGHDVSRMHSELWRLGDGNGARVLHDMSPWKSDGRIVAIPTWQQEKPVWLYELQPRRGTSLRTGSGLPLSVQWAPDRDLLLLSFAAAGELFDSSGQRQRVAHWAVAADDSFFTHWTRGGAFWLLARATRQSPTLITLYDAETAQPIRGEAVDPADLLPYDAAVYDGISRDQFTLSLRSGAMGVGMLLDTWHDVRADADGHTLLLATYRPTSPPYQRAGQLMCNAEARWIKVELTG